MLNSRARRFFRDVLVLHDGTLTRFEVGDNIADAESNSSLGNPNRREVKVRMFVRADRDGRVYVLEYKGVTRVEVNFPGKLILFPAGMYPNFGDWGYDELTAPEKGIFRHEILFASGASIAIEFRDFVFRRKPGRRKKR